MVPNRDYRKKSITKTQTKTKLEVNSTSHHCFETKSTKLYSKMLLVKSSDDNFVFSPAFYQIMCFMKGGISIYADYGPLRYVLWCCSSICHQLNLLWPSSLQYISSWVYSQHFYTFRSISRRLHFLKCAAMLRVN